MTGTGRERAVEALVEPDWSAIDHLRMLSKRITRTVHVQPSDLAAVLAALDLAASQRLFGPDVVVTTVEDVARRVHEKQCLLHWVEGEEDLPHDGLQWCEREARRLLGVDGGGE